MQLSAWHPSEILIIKSIENVPQIIPSSTQETLLSPSSQVLKYLTC